MGSVTTPAPLAGSLDVRFIPESIDIATELVLDVGRRRVFDALLHISSWWPTRQQPGAEIVFEPYVGGRFFESCDDGNGVLLGQVSTLVTPDAFAITGSLGLDGPVQGVWTVRLDVAGHDKTLLRGRHLAFGAIDAAVRATAVAGWASSYASLRRYLQA
jgi:uncharacterized protein YndB with AHSA1/START domain